METRKFNLGDWVKVKGHADSPKMKVLRYLSQPSPAALSFSEAGPYLECVYYRNGKRRSRIIHQNRLLKVWPSRFDPKKQGRNLQLPS